MSKYSNDVYEMAINLLAQQIVASVREDAGDEDMAEEYVGDAAQQLTKLVKIELNRP